MTRDDLVTEGDARAALAHLDLPVDWRIQLADYTPQLATIGESSAVVIRFLAADRPPLFLKADSGPFAEVPAEAERLAWLAQQELPAPRIIDRIEQRGAHMLLMSAIPGHDMASVTGLAPAAIARLAGEALGALHAHDPQSCPFDHRIANRLPVARRNIEAGRAHPVWEHPALTPEAAWAELLATRPPSEDLVVTHGDACFPNLLVESGRFTGFVDCARLGLADRWQDLALALGSLERNYGAGYEQAFLDGYGPGEIDRDRRTWYLLLDEFF